LVAKLLRALKTNSYTLSTKEDIMWRVRNVVVIICVVLLPVLLSGQVEQWVYRYNGPGNSLDKGNSIVYGDDGRIYVAGYSYSSGNDADIVVIKLDTAGEPCWVYRYSEPEHEWESANQIVYGDDSNLYIAGVSGLGLASGENKDFVVISIDTAGNERWVYRYNGTGQETDYEEAHSIVYGYGDDNIYVAGTIADTLTKCDFAVISLTTDGDERWIYRYNGPGNSNDVARSILYSSFMYDHLKVGGHSVGDYEDLTVVTLDTDGNEVAVWRKAIGSGTTDLLEQIGSYVGIYTYVCGTTYTPPYSLMKFLVAEPGGWTYIYSNGEYSGCAYSVVAWDGVYAVGYTDVVGTYDFTVIKLDKSSGSEEWVYQYNAPGSGYSFALSTAYDLGHSVLNTVGYTPGDGTGDDITVISLDNAGNERWVYRYNGPGNGSDMGKAIANITSGYSYVTGSSKGVGTGYNDLVVISLRDTLLVGIGVFVVTPSSIDFGDVFVDSSETDSVTVTNTGSAILNVSSVVSDNSEFSVTPNTGSIPPGDGMQFYITFAPVDTGMETGNIIFTHNGITSPDTVTVTGNGMVGVKETKINRIPAVYSLFQGYPNPFKTKTCIRYQLPHSQFLEVVIYNIAGQRVRTLIGEHKDAGFYTVYWDGKDMDNHRVNNGIYFCRMETDSYSSIKKLILVD
jgi:hypothetical protein